MPASGACAFVPSVVAKSQKRISDSLLERADIHIEAPLTNGTSKLNAGSDEPTQLVGTY